MDTTETLDTMMRPTARGFQMAKHLLSIAAEHDIEHYLFTRELVMAAAKLLAGMPLQDVRDECEEEMNDLYAEVQEGLPYHEIASTVNAKGQTLYELGHTFLHLAD